MTNDAKLGLLAGLAAVVAVAVVYFPKPPAEAKAAAERPAAVSLAPASIAPTLGVAGPGR